VAWRQTALLVLDAVMVILPARKEQSMADDTVQAELERLRAENEVLKGRATKGVTLKVSGKGGVSVYGLGRFPVTLYKEQWEKLLDMAERLKTVLQEALAVRGDAPTVFVTESEKPWLFRNFSSVFRRACERAGIEPCSPHTLRHTFASRLVMAGVDLRTVQELLGHKDIKMTLRYTHLAPAHKRAAIAALEQRFPAQKSHQFSQHPGSSHFRSDTKVVNFR